MFAYPFADDLEGNVRIINGDFKEATKAAKEEFLGMLEKEGLSVLPEKQKQWWKYCDDA